MNKKIIFASLVLAISILMIQVGGVFAAPTSQAFPSITGIVQSITIEADPNTGIVTVVVDVIDNDQNSQSVRVSEKAAEKLGLVVPDSDGNPMINKSALGQSVEIKLSAILPNQEENQHPVGSALATFFSAIKNKEIANNDTLYDVIMQAHNQGFGFGVIAQALWLTRQLNGDTSVFKALLDAKESGNYDNLPFVIKDKDGTIIKPENWGQLRKAINGNLGIVMSNKDNTNKDNSGNNNASGNNKDKNKEKGKDKNNNGNGNSNGDGNSNDNGNGSGSGNNNGKGNGNGNGNGNGQGK